MHQDLLSIEDITANDLNNIFQKAQIMKKQRLEYKEKPLRGKSIGMIFSKSSTRTRVSFEVGINELGGNSIFLEQTKMQVGRGETMADTAEVLSRYLHAVVIRTHEHESILEFARHASIPVINALTDKFHPCQALTDLFSIYEQTPDLSKVKMSYFGDGASNMANSLILAAKISGMELVVSAPEDFRPPEEIMQMDIGPGKVSWVENPEKAAEGASFLYTDVWVSMGFEEESSKRRKKLAPYQVNAELLEKAEVGAKIMHCLPAHRGEEITAEVIDSTQSIVLEQAENRLHVQKAILSIMMGE